MSNLKLSGLANIQTLVVIELLEKNQKIEIHNNIQENSDIIIIVKRQIQ